MTVANYIYYWCILFEFFSVFDRWRGGLAVGSNKIGSGFVRVEFK